ncbi:MAG: PBSX family phage terminase large subunit [Oscillospiraceae bacterium]|jgi:PBSX family phage terminase large subunit|nr:PBSX family phage terminase large subunit [Oscillospiraceae bacterium]
MIKKLSPKQLKVFTWWHPLAKTCDCDGIICDGAVRSGKTLCMTLSYIFWAFSKFNNGSFAICGKTIRSVRRNIVTPIISELKSLDFEIEDKISANMLIIRTAGKENRFYLFGGKDESSSGLIQGMTLSGVFFDEVALMPRSFCEQALARCSVQGSAFWFNCNPEYPGHWFYREWILKCKEKNILYLHFTMKDNPSLGKKMLARYENLYSGPFYKRFVLGQWVAVTGAVYPFMSHDSSFCNLPDEDFAEYAVSCDYGTVNPASFGLWAKGKNTGVWYRIDEYYYDSKKEGEQRTDEEHYKGLSQLIAGRNLKCVVVDPSAASFIQVIKRHGDYRVFPAKNNVLNGIRKVAAALKNQKIKICKNCSASVREFSLYRWDEKTGTDSPLKENDHAMDDIRYFVTTVLENTQDGFIALAVER